MPRRRFPTVVALLFTLVLCGALRAGENPELLKLKWERISLGKSNSASSVAVDAAGVTHALVGRAVKGGDFVLTHTAIEGRRKTSEVVTSEDTGQYTALAVDSQGGLHACYSTSIPGGAQLVYAFNDGTGWVSEVVEPGGQSISLQLDDAGTPHVVHIDGNSTSDVRYARRTPTGWESELIADDGLWFGDSSLLLRDGQVHVTYTRQDFERPLLAATRDTGGMWTTEVVDVNGMESSSAFDESGTLHVLYTSSALKHATNSGSGWETEDVVTANTFFGVPFPDGITAISEDTAIGQGPQGQVMLAGIMQLSNGKGFANALFVAPVVDLVVYPNILEVSPKLGLDVELAVGSHGLSHLTVRQGEGTTLYRLKGKRLKLAVKSKGAGEVAVSQGRSGGDTTCDARCKLGFFPGMDLTLTATPADGFAFDEWRGGCAGTAPTCDLTLDANTKVMAKFVKTP